MKRSVSLITAVLMAFALNGCSHMAATIPLSLGASAVTCPGYLADGFLEEEKTPLLEKALFGGAVAIGGTIVIPLTSVVNGAYGGLRMDVKFMLGENSINDKDWYDAVVICGEPTPEANEKYHHKQNPAPQSPKS